MNFNILTKVPKLNYICGKKNNHRENLEHVYVDKRHIVATDAHVLAWMPTNLLFDLESIKNLPEDGILIHQDKWKLFIDTELIYKDETVQSGAIIVNIIENKNNEDKIIFPNWKSIITDIHKKEIEKEHLTVNLDNLTKLNKSFDCSIFKFNFTVNSILAKFGSEKFKNYSYEEIGAIIMLMKDLNN